VYELLWSLSIQGVTYDPIVRGALIPPHRNIWSAANSSPWSRVEEGWPPASLPASLARWALFMDWNPHLVRHPQRIKTTCAKYSSIVIVIREIVSCRNLSCRLGRFESEVYSTRNFGSHRSVAIGRCLPLATSSVCSCENYLFPLCRMCTMKFWERLLGFHHPTIRTPWSRKCNFAAHMYRCRVPMILEGHGV
jgi:hypothetical protein